MNKHVRFIIIISPLLLLFTLQAKSQNHSQIVSEIQKTKKLTNALQLADEYLKKDTTKEYSETAAIIAQLEKLKTTINSENGHYMEIMAKLNFLNENYNQAVTFYQAAIKLYSEQDKIKKVAINTSHLADVYNEMVDYISAIEYYEKALLYYIELNDSEGICLEYRNLGKAYLIWGQYDKTVFYLNKALQIAKTDNDVNDVTSIYTQIAEIYREWGEYNNAFDYYNQLIAYQNKNLLFADIPHTLNAVGEIYLEWKLFSEAETYFREALEKCTTLNDSVGMAKSYHNLGNCFAQSTKYNEAINLYFQTLKLNSKIGSTNEISEILFDIGSVYAKSDSLAKAIDFFNRSLEMAKKVGNASVAKECYKGIYEIHERNGEYKEALKAHEMYFMAHRSIASRTSQANIAELRVIHETNKRMKENENLKQTQIIQELELRNKKIRINMLSLLFIFVFIIALILYFLYRNSKKNKDFLQEIINSIGNPLFVINSTTHRIELANKSAIAEGFLTGENYYTTKLSDDSTRNRPIDNSLLDIIIEKKTESKKEFSIRKNDQDLYFEINSFPIFDAKKSVIKIIETVVDISELKKSSIILRQNNELLTLKNQEISAQTLIIQESLEQKKILLKEIHHRVKNNLQIISSLLNLQANTIKDKIAIATLHEGQNRVQAMALVHKTLYQTDDLSQIPMENYIKQLISYLGISYKIRNKQITSNIQAQNITLNVDTAIPLGLILNELISNSFKYAFNETEKGEIKIFITQQNSSTYLLHYADSGPGLPSDFDYQKASSLGLRLINILSKQIMAQLKYENNNGLNFFIAFDEQNSR